MPISKLFKLLAMVIGAAGLTVAIAVFAANSLDLPGNTMVIALPVLASGYLLWRFVTRRSE